MTNTIMYVCACIERGGGGGANVQRSIVNRVQEARESTKKVLKPRKFGNRGAVFKSAAGAGPSGNIVGHRPPKLYCIVCLLLVYYFKRTTRW